MQFFNKLIFRITITIMIPIVALSGIIIYIMYIDISNLTISKYTRDLAIVSNNYIEYIDSEIHSKERNAKLDAVYISQNNFLSESELLNLTRENVLMDSLIYGSAIIFAKNKFRDDKEYAFFYSYESGDEIKQISFQDKTDPDFFNYYAAQMQWWDKPSKTLKPGWTDLYFDKDAGRVEMVTYYHPFFINDEFKGIITIDLSLNKLTELLLVNEKTLEKELSSDLFIIGSDSTIIYANTYSDMDIKQIIGKNIITEKIQKSEVRKYDLNESLKVLELALKNESGKMDIHSNNNPNEKHLAFYSSFRSTSWFAISIIPYKMIEEKAFKLLTKNIILVAIFIILLIGIIIFIAQLITKPIVKLSDLSLQIADGDFEEDIDLNRNDEIGMLASNFNKMQKELKKRETEILKANKELMELDVAKNKFLLLISHEIRTPLNGIMGATDILYDSIEDPEIKEFIAMLEESVNRLDTFSKKALEITQMQTVGKELDKSEILVSTSINNVIEAYRPYADNKQIKIITDFSNHDSLEVVENYFVSSIDELINNAIKFSYDDTVIEIKTFIEDNVYKISFANTGNIIPLNKKEEVTKAFGLVEKHIDKNIGLGLNYVQTFIDIHEASMNIESDEERTVVTLSFEKY